MVYAILSWLSAFACIAAVWSRARRLGRIALPSSAVLVARVRSADCADPEEARLRARMDLDELLLEVDKETRVGAELPRSLARVSLASGTALSLLALIQSMPSPAWLPVGAAFLGGFAGLSGASGFGRVADARARAAREHWTHAVRRAYAQL